MKPRTPKEPKPYATIQADGPAARYWLIARAEDLRKLTQGRVSGRLKQQARGHLRTAGL